VIGYSREIGQEKFDCYVHDMHASMTSWSRTTWHCRVCRSSKTHWRVLLLARRGIYLRFGWHGCVENEHPFRRYTFRQSCNSAN